MQLIPGGPRPPPASATTPTTNVVDGAKAQVILSALVVPADVKDNQPMLDLLWRTSIRWNLKPHHVTGDSIYGSLENIKAIENAGIRAFMPVRDWTHTNPSSFSKEDFLLR